MDDQARVFLDVLTQGFLDILSSSADYPSEQLKAVSKWMNRSLNAAGLLHAAEYRRRHPQGPLMWWSTRPILKLQGPL